MTRVALTINGKPVAQDVTPRTHLADFLREQLLLTGTHIGCEHGICGACTVEINGEIARSCITYAVACDGAEVRTIEGFDDDPLMARLRQAFTEAHALQCGYCTPGMLIAARDLVRRKRALSRPEIRIEMSGNLCRCTGYQGIVDAIERVMAEPGLAAEARGGAGSWLGPAPGPAASPVSQEARAVQLARHESRSAAAPARRGKRPPIKVEVGSIEEVDGATRLTQSFTLAHPREAVWALMSDVAAVARCMPGAALDGPPEGDKLSGRLQAKIGPITASFAGQGTLARFDSGLPAGDQRQRRRPQKRLARLGQRRLPPARHRRRRGNARRGGDQLRADRTAGAGRPLRHDPRSRAPHRRGLRPEHRRRAGRAGCDGRSGADRRPYARAASARRPHSRRAAAPARPAALGKAPARQGSIT